MSSIQQWQQPGRDTRVYNKFGAFKCHECKERTTSVSSMSLICCADDRTVVQYCSDCWDNEPWNCPDCNKIPDDCDVVGCERCGQWTHLGCQTTLEDKKDYVCVSCKESARAHTLVPQMKVECYDLTKNLGSVKKQLSEKKEQLHSLTQAHEKTLASVRELQSESGKATKDLESMSKVERVRTAQLRETHREKESIQKALSKALTNINETKRAFELATECYETQIGEQTAELDRANSKVASLATDVMQQADDLQSSKKVREIAYKQYVGEISTLKGVLKASKEELADVHGYYANEILALKRAIVNKQRSEEQEIIALRDNNKRLLSNNGSLAKSNQQLKLVLQDERAKNVEMMSCVKKTNKRARYIYEQQGERIAALKKARVTIRWNGSMPKRLQERLLLQRYRDAWLEFKCQWQDYFGEMRVRAHYANGPIVYNTLDGFMCGIRKRDNEEK